MAILIFHCAKGVRAFRMTRNMFAIVSVFKAGISFFLKCFLNQTNRRAYNSLSAYKWPDRIGIFIYREFQQLPNVRANKWEIQNSEQICLASKPIFLRKMPPYSLINSIKWTTRSDDFKFTSLIPTPHLCRILHLWLLSKIPLLMSSPFMI